MERAKIERDIRRIREEICLMYFEERQEKTRHEGQMEHFKIKIAGLNVELENREKELAEQTFDDGRRNDKKKE